MSFLQQQIDKWRERFRDPLLWMPKPQTVRKDPNWQPIESAPKDGTEILLYPYAVCKWDAEDEAFFRDDSDICPPTPHSLDSTKPAKGHTMKHSPYSMSKPYAGESGGKCVSIDCVNPHYYSGVDYNTQEEKDDAHRILNALNATAQLPDTILQNLAQHPGRLYAITKWFKHIATYHDDHNQTLTVCALCNHTNSHAENCPLPAILETLEPL